MSPGHCLVDLLGRQEERPESRGERVAGGVGHRVQGRGQGHGDSARCWEALSGRQEAGGWQGQTDDSCQAGTDRQRTVLMTRGAWVSCVPGAALNFPSVC